MTETTNEIEPRQDWDALAPGLLVTVNAWNTVGVTTRAWEPGSYEP